MVWVVILGGWGGYLGGLGGYLVGLGGSPVGLGGCLGGLGGCLGDLTRGPGRRANGWALAAMTPLQTMSCSFAAGGLESDVCDVQKSHVKGQSMIVNLCCGDHCDTLIVARDG